MAAFDFTGLTPAQRALLDGGGWSIGCGRIQPGPRAVAKLIARGLLVERRTHDRKPGTFTILVSEYYMPPSAASAWLARKGSP